MERSELDSLKQRTSCVDLAGRYVTLRKASRTEFEGPCPKCGGTDRLHVKTDTWFCRHCYPLGNDQPHDAIAFVRWLTGASFAEAVETLGGNTMIGTNIPTRPARKATVKQQPDDWPAFAVDLLERAERHLWDSAGGDYVTARDLNPETCGMYRLGYVERAERVRKEWQVPAIVIPWFKGGRTQPVAIKYRFLTPVNGVRLVSAAGSDFTNKLFGGQALWVDTGTDDRILAKRRLVLCEGEINAMSIYQVTQDLRTDVLSIGSEAQRLTDAQVAFALRYGTRIVWADKPSVRDELALLVKAHTSMASQATDDAPAKVDANDCLRKGTLYDTMLRAFRAGPDKEALHWDLWDAEHA